MQTVLQSFFLIWAINTNCFQSCKWWSSFWDSEMESWQWWTPKHIIKLSQWEKRWQSSFTFREKQSIRTGVKRLLSSELATVAQQKLLNHSWQLWSLHLSEQQQTKKKISEMLHIIRYWERDQRCNLEIKLWVTTPWVLHEVLSDPHTSGREQS